jgi:integrase
MEPVMNGGRFPQRIKRGSVVVSIYQTPTKSYTAFTVVHYDATGARCRRMFASYTKAREAATETAANLAVGKPDVHVLTGHELVTYRRASQALYATGVELDVAVTQFAQAVKALGDVPLSEVVNAYMNRKQPQIKRKLVSEVVQELLTAKRDKGRSALYIKDLRLRLERVAKVFTCPLADVTPADIDKFLLALTSSPRSRNNFRQVIGTLLKFGQIRGYVAKDHAGIGAVEKSSHTQAEVVVFTPNEIDTLLSTAKQELVPALALGAFAGIRPEEIKRLHWADVNLNEGHIEIRAANAKTRVRRLIPVQPNLRSWLLPYVQPSGPVQPFANLTNQFLKAAGRAKVKWKRNGLRHSFISYRVAHTANVAAVALEAGNSPQVISRNYLKCVTADEAGKWFGIFPPPMKP